MKVLLFLSLIGFNACNGHVRMIYSSTQMSIRNAQGPTENGRFSTSGPCGGNNNFGAQGVQEVTNGDKICATINYNGGHKGNANKFQAKFLCGGVGNQNAFEADGVSALTLVEGTEPAPDADGKSVPAPRGNEVTTGYTLCVNMPEQTLNGVADGATERQCTLAIHDQRGWGGCIDFDVQDKPPAPTISPTPAPITPAVFPATAEGVYKVSDCDKLAGGECCMQGYLVVSSTGQISGDLQGISHTEFDGKIPTTAEELASKELCATYKDSIATILSWIGDADATFKSEINVQSSGINAAAVPQKFEFETKNTKTAGINAANTGLDAPIVSDSKLTYYSTYAQAIAEGVIADPNAQPNPNPSPSNPGPTTPIGAPSGNPVGAPSGTPGGAPTDNNDAPTGNGKEPEESSTPTTAIIAGVAGAFALGGVGVLMKNKRGGSQVQQQRPPSRQIGSFQAQQFQNYGGPPTSNFQQQPSFGQQAPYGQQQQW